MQLSMVGCSSKKKKKGYGWLYCQVSSFFGSSLLFTKKGNLDNASALTNLENDETFTFVKILADQDETALLLFFKNNFTDR